MVRAMAATAVNPPDLAKPRGYAHGMLASGKVLAIAGQIGWSGSGRLVGGGFVAQFEQALSNVSRVLAHAGGLPEDLISARIFVTDKRAYLAAAKALGVAWRRYFGRHYPAMAVVEVKDLLEEGALLEIEAMAVLP
jgi:enamine deaminase RidA (YjgF/YER057c/UK114 family)